MQFPESHRNHLLEEKSETFFRQHRPQDWTITVPNKDYGQDLNIEICEDGEYRGLDLIVQLKSSATSDKYGETERQPLKVSTYNYLRNNLRVVMLVKFIEDENEAWWILLKDIQPPSTPNQESFTVYLPKQNKLSTLKWNEIVDYVRSVTDKKLAASRVADSLRKIDDYLDDSMNLYKDHEEVIRNYKKIKELLKAISDMQSLQGTNPITLESYKARVQDLELKNKELEKKASRYKSDKNFKTRFEEQVRLKQEIEVEKKRVYQKVGLNLSVLNVKILISQKHYSKAIGILKKDIGFLEKNLISIELEEHHEQYLQLMLTLVTCYQKKNNYNAASALIKKAFDFSISILSKYNFAEQEKQFVIVCEYYIDMLKLGIDSSWILRKARIAQARQVYNQILFIEKKRPFRDRLEAHRFILAKDSLYELLAKKNKPGSDSISATQSNVDEIFNLGYNKIAEGKYEEAYFVYTTIIEAGPTYPNIFLMRGVVSGLLKDFDSAIRNFDLVLYYDPKNKEAFLNKGRTLLEAGGMANIFMATLCFDKALAIDPDYMEAYVNRGMSYILDKRHSLGCQDFRKALKLGYEPAKELIQVYCEKEEVRKNDIIQ